MPKGPQGQKRPADVIGAAVMVAKIATGEASEKASESLRGRSGGLSGGKARAQKLSAKERQEIAQKAFNRCLLWTAPGVDHRNQPYHCPLDPKRTLAEPRAEPFRSAILN